jgi:hypothetical protein
MSDIGNLEQRFAGNTSGPCTVTTNAVFFNQRDLRI